MSIEMATDPDLLAEATQRELARLEALETLSASKLTLAQQEELVALRAKHGTTYDRKLVAARTKFKSLLANSPRFEILRTSVTAGTIRDQLDKLSDISIPTNLALMTPDKMREKRAEIANKLITVSSLRRHCARAAGKLSSAVELAEEMWMGMSPADREWRMKGEIAEMLASERAVAQDHKLLEKEADSIYWDMIRMLETVEQIAKDWDRCTNMEAARRPQQTQDDNGL